SLKNSQNWEFIFITTYSNTANKIFETIKNQFEFILQLKDDSSPIQNIKILIKKIQNQTLRDKYGLFAYSYSFLIDLLGYLKNVSNTKLSIAVSESIPFIEQNYIEKI